MNFNKKICFERSYKLPIILQDEIAECGYACLVMISNFWGHDLDLQAIRKIKKISNRGITLLELKYLFEDLGFIVRALKVPLDEFHMIRCPAILHWNMNHFVVLKKVKKKLYYNSRSSNWS
ncbi:cysteine peptidase family C39 domain-containing protein [Legionella oakridgensis]|uniref:ABC-type bacteriocin/lantibiotic exporters, containing an N-terminal double-glycine peptidase domain n=2 Tax=Legionella oakridgensis TaxID=29423 RepID=W0BBY8_9GAMM|nr:cysteine peptidase family C39 domain-containing protein [Legionella oakridgensis]AHE66206.1 ABC-type bacteriocin/lantibiotic exporters, containing an N-terminal double-glycine peptidase domain [Legionella oakridgensis ATCC 33761 = DSM 21215]KTD42325.1 ABC transporter [Legionella oakridgensis]STY16113.1 ABC transporter [Legionella longbeachae]